MMRTRSLRSRILIRLLPVLLGVLVVSGGLSYFGARYYVNQVFDRALVDSLSGLASRVMVRNGVVVFDFPEAAQRIFEWDLDDAAYYRVESRRRGHLAGQTDLDVGNRSKASIVSKSVEAWDGTYRNRRVRAASKLLYFPNVDDEIRVTVVETTLARERFSEEILLTVLIPQFFLIGLAIFIIRRTINTAITPVSDAAKQLEERTHHTEELLDDSRIPDEIRPLTVALNSLLSRLQQALEIQRRFVADAAHQLRTPLTALRLHIENAMIQNRMEDARPMLEQVKLAADRSIRLSQQLLTLAQSEEIILRGQQEAFDLSAVITDMTTLWRPKAEQAGIDLRLSGFSKDQPLFLLSNSDLLTQVIDNLIDNALRYCPAGSWVEISCGEIHNVPTSSDHADERPGWLVLHVTDNGPGIALEEREFVLRRFVRGDQTRSAEGATVQGSGLGLSIASEIMARLNGRLTIGDPPGHKGLRVTLEIPGLISPQIV